MAEKSWKLLQAEASRHLEKGEVERAAHLLLEAIELAPDEARLYEQLVHAALLIGGVETAVKAASELTRLAPRNAHFAYLRAVAAMAAGDFAVAQQVLEEALAGTPENGPDAVELLHAAAQVARHMSQPSRALGLLARAVQQAPTSAALVGDYASLLIEGQQYAAAREALAPAARVHPSDAGLQLAMATVCAKLGEWKTAWVHAVRAKDTDDPQVREQAVRLVGQIGVHQ